MQHRGQTRGLVCFGRVSWRKGSDYFGHSQALAAVGASLGRLGWRFGRSRNTRAGCVVGLTPRPTGASTQPCAAESESAEQAHGGIAYVRTPARGSPHPLHPTTPPLHRRKPPSRRVVCSGVGIGVARKQPGGRLERMGGAACLRGGLRLGRQGSSPDQPRKETPHPTQQPDPTETCPPPPRQRGL